MENNIIKIIQDYIVVDEKVRLESKLIEDLNVDSLQMMAILSEIEALKNVQISYSKLRDVITVQDLINCVERKKYGN